MGAGFVGTPSESFVRERFFDLSFLDGYEVVEGKWIEKPFAYVSILHDAERDVNLYHVTEPEMDDFECHVRETVEGKLRSIVRGKRGEVGEDENKEEVFEELLEDVLSEHGSPVEDGVVQKLYYYFRRDFLGYGLIDPIMNDPEIEDISCNGHELPVYIYHREYRDLRTNLLFGEDELDRLTIRLAQRGGRHISVSDPLISTILPDDSRAQLTLGSDIGSKGSNFTIRKYLDTPLTPIDLIKFDTFSIRQMAFLWLAIENKKSIIFAGPTASGKTTSMNAASFFLPPDSKVVSAEMVREVSIPHKNWVSEVTREASETEQREGIDMYDLLQYALHKRPEYLLVGEIRAEPEVVRTFFHSIFTGHPGATTFHAKSAEAAVNRFLSAPLSVTRRMINSLDLISVQDQVFVGDKRVRRNRDISELYIPSEGDEIETTKLFEWQADTDSFDKLPNLSGSSRVLKEIGEDRGWGSNKIQEEISRRETVLTYLTQNDITDYDDVVSVIHRFARTPDYILERIREGELDPKSLGSEGL